MKLPSTKGVVCANCKNHTLEDRVSVSKSKSGFWGKWKTEEYTYKDRRCNKFERDFIDGAYYSNWCFLKNSDGDCPDYEYKGATK
jgi:hypothetical protein